MTRQGKQKAPASGTAGQQPQPQQQHQQISSKSKGKRGAPQTFAATLFRILHEGTPIVGWSEEGDSFTVHNDKDFEREILTANYRHGKFSSFQRQLNMYGFRKVPDCSDRTYSHPFFRRNCPQLLKKVRRVVAGNNHSHGSGSGGDNRGVGRARPATLPPMSGLGAGAAGLGAVFPGVTAESCGRGTAEAGNGDRIHAQPPARKKTRMCVQRAGSSTGGGSDVGGLFSRPPHNWGDDSGVLRNADPVRQAKRNSSVASVAAQALLRQAPGLPPPPPPALAFSSPRASAVTSGHSTNASQHEYPSSWYLHTGLWGGVTNTFDEKWTSGSSSAASSVDASSPVLLPITTADVESRDGIPPFHLPAAPAATVAVLAPVSPMMSAAAAATTPSGGSVGFGYDGMMALSASKCSTRTVSPTERGTCQKASYGVWSTYGANGTSNTRNISRAGSGGPRGGGCDAVNDGSLQQAFGFGEAIASRQQFDLGFNLDLANGRSDTGAAAPKKDPVPISPPSTTGDAAVTPSTSSVGWEISSLGGAGWGSPGTSDSVAAAPWAALPHFYGGVVGSGSSIRSPRTPVGGVGGGAAPGTPGGCNGNGLAVTSSGAGGEGRDVPQQQQPFAMRTLSNLAAVESESFDWPVLEDGCNDDDASFSGLASPQGFDEVEAFCGTGSNGGCDVSRALASLSPSDMSLCLPCSAPPGSGFSDESTQATTMTSAPGRMSTPLGDESWTLGSSRSMFA